MKLLTEINTDAKFLTEEKEGKKNYFIEGVFLQSEVKNRNGRIYPKNILSREVTRYTKENVEKNRAWGELNHPDSPTINLDRVSHMIVDLHEEGNNFCGKAKIVDTPMGRIVKALIDEGGSLGVSSRGMGTLKPIRESEYQLVQDDYFLSTPCDIVSDPSAPDAFVRGIMEKREWCWDNGLIAEADISKMQKEIAKANQAQLEEVSLRIFSNFLNKL
jgi:hypothetical protein